MGLMTILSNAKYDDKKSNENLHDIDLLLSIFNSIKNQLLIENDCDIKLWIYQVISIEKKLIYFIFLKILFFFF